MEKKIELRVMRCPTCGGELNVKDDTTPVECIYCGNTVKPVILSDESVGGGFGANAGFVKIDGIKTADSAIAYLDLFLEEYDWDSFVFSLDITVPALERIAETIKTSSADNPRTWIYCAKILVEPFLRKCSGCEGLIDEIVKRYRENDPDAYSLFDVYTRLRISLAAALPGVKDKLQKYVSLAEKYGADAAELAQIRAYADKVENAVVLKSYTEITDIKEVCDYDLEKDSRMEAALREKGINAAETYTSAKKLISQKQYDKALELLLTLDLYKDAAALADSLNHFFLIDQVIEIGDARYVLLESNKECVDLYASENGKMKATPILKGIRNALCAFANTMFFIDNSGHLNAFSADDGKTKVLGKNTFSPDDGFGDFRNSAYYLFTAETPKKLFRIDLIKQTVTEVADKIGKVISQEIPYLAVKSAGDELAGEVANVGKNEVLNVRTGARTVLGKGKISVAGYIGSKIVYTRQAPNQQNQHLYIREVGDENGALLLEENIYSVIKLYSGRIYYTVGSAASQTLISIQPDGSDRREISLHIKDLLMERGGWLYFVRSTLFNSVMFRSRPDGSEQTVICRDVEKFVDERGGYLYYIDTDGDLQRVRMDGSGRQTLCREVKEVLCIKDDKIIYTAKDSSKEYTDSLGANRKVSVNSVYATDFFGKGRRKLAYDVVAAEANGDDQIYYVKKARFSEDGSAAGRILCSIRCSDYEQEDLLNYSVSVVKNGCYVATCVYGSYDCPEVWTLRRFRDNILAKTLLGRLFIMLYYAVSPTLVQLFGDTRWFRAVWRPRLDSLVRKLEARGVENTPYEDKNW